MRHLLFTLSSCALLLPATSAASTLAVNFVNAAGDAAQAQPGFTDLLVANLSGAGGSVLNAGSVGGVSISLQNVDVIGANNRIRSIDRGDNRVYQGIYSNLSVGWIGNEDGGDQLLLTLSGLTAGAHSWTSYHIDNGTGLVGNGNQNGKMRIELSLDGGTNFSIVATDYEILDAEASIGESAQPSDPANFTFTTPFVSDGVNNVVFRFTNTSVGGSATLAADAGQDFTVVNGFEVSEVAVPEPGSVALLATLGLAAFVRRRTPRA